MGIFNGFFDNLINATLHPKGTVADYQHAARLYIDNNMRLAPKFTHLYHVVLNVNPAVANTLTKQNIPEINLLAKSADLPKFSLETNTLNQYNRKKIVYSKINYEPINIEFHDDNAGLTTLLWEIYFRYYAVDSNYTHVNADGSPAIDVDAYKKVNSGMNNIYGNSVNYRYGLDQSNKVQNFFTSIQIYQLNGQNGRPTYTSFTLINPFITNFVHDQMSQDNARFSSNKLTIQYEAVEYNRGYTKVGTAPPDFGEIHYDKTPSPLTTQGGGAATLFGQAGVIAGAANTFGAFQSGNILGGIINGVNTLHNMQNLSGNTIVNQLANAGESILVNSINNVVFSNQNNNNTTPTVANQKTF